MVAWFLYIGFWSGGTFIEGAAKNYGGGDPIEEKSLMWSEASKDYFIAGNSGDTWNEAWTPSIINGLDFGVYIVLYLDAMYGDAVYAYIDHIRLTVYYTQDPVSRPFAYNPTRIPIDGTTLLGDLAIGTSAQDYSTSPGGVFWWNGPDENLGYVICAPVPTGDHPTPIGNIGTIRFWRSEVLSENKFIETVNILFQQGFNSGRRAADYLNNTEEFWTSWETPDNDVISAGKYHSASLYDTGRIWGWGVNNIGDLGINSTEPKYTPYNVVGKTFCEVNKHHAEHTLAIDYRGQIWSWGHNLYGQLGIESIVHQSTPVSIHGTNKTFCNIGTGTYHSLSIDKDGIVWGWGYNNVGQLGDNSITWRSTPVSIHGANKTFCKIESSFNQSIALDKNGKLWAWGINDKAQLGTGDYVSRSTPVSIAGNKTFCKIGKLNSESSFAIDKDGKVWGWGYNGNGQLGRIFIVITPTEIIHI